MIAHVPSEDWIVDREPTVDFAGSAHKECVNCGTNLETKVLGKLPSEETTAQEETEEVTTATEETTASTEEQKGGCGSSIALTSALSMSAMIALGAVVCKKRR